MRKFLLVGLTGGIATGKSTVSDMLRRRGAVIIDADVLAREVVAPGEPALAEIAREFGAEVIAPDGTLDRKKLGAIVFADPARRKRLETITHPAIRERFARQLAELMARGFDGLVFFDAPVMIESGNYRNMDRMVVVATDEATQRARLLARERITPAEAEQKIRSQMPLAEKVALADYVIDNSGDRARTEAEVERVFRALETERDTATRLADEAMPLAAIFPIDLGNYGRNRLAVSQLTTAFNTTSTAVRFVAFHRRPSGNFLFRDIASPSRDEARNVVFRATRRSSIVRSFPDLVRLAWHVPANASVIRGSTVVRVGRSVRRVVAVMLSADIGGALSAGTTVRRRIEIVAWASARDAICLYDRPLKHGDLGQVSAAVVDALKKAGCRPDLHGTARGMSIIRDLLHGRVVAIDWRGGGRPRDTASAADHS